MMQNKKKRMFFASLFTGMLLFCASACQGQPVNTTVNKESGKTTAFYSISQKEQEFYASQSFAKTDKEIEEKVVTYAKNTYGAVSLAQKHNVIEKFSFDILRAECEQLNQKNKNKKEQGEVVMGILHYDLGQYFDYYMSKLKSDIIQKIAQNPSPALQEEALAYYDANRSRFSRGVSVTYREKRPGENKWGEPVTLEWEQLKTLSKADEEFFNLLCNAPQNAEQLIEGRVIRIEQRESSQYSPKTDSNMILTIFLSDVKYEELLQEEADKIELKFQS